MSYTYLLERGEESSGECFSDIPAYVLSRLNLTHEKSFSNASETESCQSSPSGTTCGPSTGNLGEDEFRLSAEVSHARTSQAQEGVPDSVENDLDYGRSSLEWFVKWNPLTFSWKTAQSSLLEGLDEFSETWPQWGMMQNGECFQREPLAQTINAPECGWLPTPVATDYKDGLSKAYRLAELYKGDRVARCLGKSWTERNLIERETRICPNPAWQEWRMMWPIGMTDLNPLEMDKFQQWRLSHGGH